MFFANKLYKEDIINISSDNIINWEELKNKSILITGATGLIGTFLVDLLMYRNDNNNDNIMIYAVGRNMEKAIARFKEYLDSQFFVFIQKDVQNPLDINKNVDYIIQGATDAHPIAYTSHPINTILTSVLGMKNILDYASTHNVQRILYLSSDEIYGKNLGDMEIIKEDYCGYIDCNTLRAGYPEGKRVTEALCQAYIKEKNLDIVIARFCRVYGPTMQNDDSKALAQFIRNAVNGENIILKSKGDQPFACCYVADICSALLVLLVNGKNGEAYNISNMASNVTLLQIANILAEYINKEVVFDTPTPLEASGYSKVTKALLDSSKLRQIGWEAQHSMKLGILRTVEILREAKQNGTECI